MLRILFVDDEPFILQGLSVLIDWEKKDLKLQGRRQTAWKPSGF